MEARSQSEPAAEGEESQHRAERLAVERNAGHYEPDAKIRWRARVPVSGDETGTAA
jgi:hypothetical protein